MVGSKLTSKLITVKKTYYEEVSCGEIAAFLEQVNINLSVELNAIVLIALLVKGTLKSKPFNVVPSLS